uniref:hypothetical protein n=1 Tax=Nocardia suismassiliense TaxID=2077092 RepID=UPI003F49770B
MIEVDDIVWRVDNHYLGPPGKTFPIAIRMNALWVGLGFAFTLLVVLRTVVHLSFSYNLVLIIAVSTAWFTSRFMRRVSPERPVRAVLRAALNDLRSPRQPKPGQTVSVRYSARLNADRHATTTIHPRQETP